MSELFRSTQRYAHTLNGIIDRLNISLETFFKMCHTVTVISMQTAAWTIGLEEQNINE